MEEKVDNTKQYATVTVVAEVALDEDDARRLQGALKAKFAEITLLHGHQAALTVFTPYTRDITEWIAHTLWRFFRRYVPLSMHVVRYRYLTNTFDEQDFESFANTEPVTCDKCGGVCSLSTTKEVDGGTLCVGCIGGNDGR